MFRYYRQKRKNHNECKRDESITKQTIFVEYIMYSSLEEAFEFCLSSFADEHNNFNKINQEKRTIEQIILHLKPHVYQIYYVNIDLHVRHQYGISVSESQMFVLAKRPQQTGTRRNSCFCRECSVQSWP